VSAVLAPENDPMNSLYENASKTLFSAKLVCRAREGPELCRRLLLLRHELTCKWFLGCMHGKSRCSAYCLSRCQPIHMSYKAVQDAGSSEESGEGGGLTAEYFFTEVVEVADEDAHDCAGYVAAHDQTVCSHCKGQINRLSS